jgi:hypothetical protein
VIEASEYTVFYEPPPLSKMRPQSVFAAVVAWSERYGIIPWFCDNRELAEHTSFMILNRWYRDHVCGEAAASAYRHAQKQADVYLRPVREMSRLAEEQIAQTVRPRIGIADGTS